MLRLVGSAHPVANPQPVTFIQIRTQHWAIILLTRVSTLHIDPVDQHPLEDVTGLMQRRAPDLVDDRCTCRRRMTCAWL